MIGEIADAMNDHMRFNPSQAQRLNDPRRLVEQVSESDLARLLDLRGNEDVADLGSGTGFYTDRIADLTTGTVYAIELQPEMNDVYRKRGIPSNVRLVPGDITNLPLEPNSVDIACSISTWHETGGNVNLARLFEILRPEGRLVVIDWRRDSESLESGPPVELRFTREEVARSLQEYFFAVKTENLGRFMFAVLANRRPKTS